MPFAASGWTERHRKTNTMISLKCIIFKMIQMNLATKQKQTHGLQKQTYGYQKGKVGGGINKELGVNMHTTIYKIDKKTYCTAQGTSLNIL